VKFISVFFAPPSLRAAVGEWLCHYLATWVPLCLLAFRGGARARASVLVFPRYLTSCEACSGLVTYLMPPVFLWLRWSMGVCAQRKVGLRLVVEPCMWTCALSIIPGFLNYVCARDTRRWIRSENSNRFVLTQHRQNPTEISLKKN
jgi:hypothetical protein